jgi:hypothetical protein
MNNRREMTIKEVKITKKTMMNVEERETRMIYYAVCCKEFFLERDV